MYENSRYAASLPLLERALSDENAKDLTPYNLGVIRFKLAQNLAALKLDRPRVLAVAALAMQDFQRSGYPKKAAEVERFVKKLR